MRNAVIYHALLFGAASAAPLNGDGGNDERGVGENHVVACDLFGFCRRVDHEAKRGLSSLPGALKGLGGHDDDEAEEVVVYDDDDDDYGYDKRDLAAPLGGDDVQGEKRGAVLLVTMTVTAHHTATSIAPPVTVTETEHDSCDATTAVQDSSEEYAKTVWETNIVWVTLSPSHGHTAPPKESSQTASSSYSASAKPTSLQSKPSTFHTKPSSTASARPSKATQHPHHVHAGAPSDVPKSWGTLTNTTDGTCGPKPHTCLSGADCPKIAYTCAGNSKGNCCSVYGHCGTGPDHCGQGCQGAFGECDGDGKSGLSKRDDVHINLELPPLIPDDRKMWARIVHAFLSVFGGKPSAEGLAKRSEPLSSGDGSLDTEEPIDIDIEKRLSLIPVVPGPLPTFSDTIRDLYAVLAKLDPFIPSPSDKKHLKNTTNDFLAALFKILYLPLDTLPHDAEKRLILSSPGPVTITLRNFTDTVQELYDVLEKLDFFAAPEKKEQLKDTIHDFIADVFATLLSAPIPDVIVAPPTASPVTTPTATTLKVPFTTPPAVVYDGAPITRECRKLLDDAFTAMYKDVDGDIDARDTVVLVPAKAAMLQFEKQWIACLTDGTFECAALPVTQGGKPITDGIPMVPGPLVSVAGKPRVPLFPVTKSGKAAHRFQW